AAKDVRKLSGECERDRSEHEADRIQQQNCLANVEPEAKDQLVVKMAAIGLSDALAAARASYDRGRRVENRQCEDEQRDDHADRDRRLARTDDRNRREDVADEQRSGVTEDDAGRVEIEREKAEC